MKGGKARRIAVLDVGTNKVVCFIASLLDDGGLVIDGIGHQVARGMRAGVITDVQEAEQSIISAVYAAEEMADVTIDRVVAGVSGVNLSSEHVRVEMGLSGQEVSDRDLMEINRQARNSASSGEQTVLHVIPVHYTLDKAGQVEDPRGMFGDTLTARIHVVSTPVKVMQNLQRCLAKCHLDIEDMVATPYASALACLDEDERQLGVTLIDIGAGVTTFTVFSRGRNVFISSIPLGGASITSDIASGLSTTLSHAERVKTLYGSAVPLPSERDEMLEVPELGEDDGAEFKQIPRSMLIGIIRPRVEEIFEIIRERLEASGCVDPSARRVVLTGGGSQLVGIKEVAAQVLGKQVRLSKPKPVSGAAVSTSGPAFASAIGMLYYTEQKIREQRRARLHMGIPAHMRWMEKLGQWVKETF